MSSWINTWNTTNGYIILYDESLNRYNQFTVTAVADSGTYFTISVTNAVGSTLKPSAGPSNITLNFIPFGSSGSSGTSGSSGSSGTSGSSGSSGTSGTSGGSLSGGSNDLIVKWLTSATIGTSVIYEDPTTNKIGINGTSPAPADYLVVNSPVGTNATVYINAQRRVGSVNAGFKYTTYGVSSETVHWYNYVQAGDTNNVLRWFSGSTDKMYLNQAGNFGLNTLPSNTLHINNTSTTQPAIRIDQANITNTPGSLGGRSFNSWLPISIAGTTYYIPLYGA